MPRFEPFRGLRYSAGPDLSRLACPPYDVIDAADRERLAAQDARNAVHLEMPIGDDAYRRAAATFNGWREDGSVVQDEPTLYAYRMTPPDSPPTYGYIGALGVTDADGLLPHERTTPKARSDRLDLLRATRVNTSPIWALSLAEGLSKLFTPQEEPIGRAVDGGGVLHEIWPVPEAEAKQISDLVGDAPAAVADGHHRWETSRNYLAERSDDPGADRILALVVELAPDQLEVRPIHRLIGTLPDGMRLPEALAPWFKTVDTAQAAIRLLTAEGETGLQALASTESAARLDADAERVQIALDALGVTELTYPHDEDTVRADVAAGKSAAGLLLRPVTIDVISAAARAGERFPPKTTFFWPKPLTGFVYRSLDG
ncbi:MAG TPA: DUF1015 domain-containing protein [Acidimicrobiales bacterium]|nr:DUF1015 domain-containing protein [Acidimicrobiales bacterium]